LTLLLDAITSSRWKCRYTNFHQLCDTTFKEYPASQKAASFSVDQVMDKLKAGNGD
jgi:hypothetical protein